MWIILHGKIIIYNGGDISLVDPVTGTPTFYVSFLENILDVFFPSQDILYVLTQSRLIRYSLSDSSEVWNVISTHTPSSKITSNLVITNLTSGGNITRRTINADTGATTNTIDLGFFGGNGRIFGDLYLETVSSGLRIRNMVQGSVISIDIFQPLLSSVILKIYNNKTHVMVSRIGGLGLREYVLAVLNSNGTVLETVHTTGLGNTTGDNVIYDFSIGGSGDLYMLREGGMVKTTPSTQVQKTFSYNTPSGFSLEGGLMELPGKFYLNGNYETGGMLIISKTFTEESSSAGSSVSDLSGIVGLDGFGQNIHSYTISLQNSSSTLSLSPVLSEGQEVAVFLNNLTVTPPNIPIPIGSSTIVIRSISENGQNTSIYTIGVTRAPPGIVHLNTLSGSFSSSGGVGQPIGSLKQALRLNNAVISATITDLLPNFGGQNSQVTLTTFASPSAPLEVEGSGGNLVKFNNPNPNFNYLFSNIPPVRQNGIMSFAFKALDPSSEEFSTSGPFQIEVDLPLLSSRTFIRLIREDDNTEITGGLIPSSSSPSVYTIVLESNSVYTVVDSGSLVVSGGMGSDPHITTIFGEKYDLPKQSRYTRGGLSLLKTPLGEIRGGVTGLRNGEFLSGVDVYVSGGKVLGINFERKRSKILNGGGVRRVDVSDNNITNIDKSIKQTEMYLVEGLWEGGVYLMVNYQHRYVCPIFNKNPRPEDGFTGALVK